MTIAGSSARRGAGFRFALASASHSSFTRASRTTKPTTITAIVVMGCSALRTGGFTEHMESQIAAVPTRQSSTEDGGGAFALELREASAHVSEEASPHVSEDTSEDISLG